MILLAGLLAGGAAGIIAARLRKRPWSPPRLRLAWLVLFAFLPQLLAFYLPSVRERMDGVWASAALVSSQLGLLAVCWGNREQPGFWLLALGLGLNLLVIVANGGFMPISPQTAAHLISPQVLEAIPLGSRFGFGKDVLLLPEATRLPWLADRFLLPEGWPYQAAFSLGDLFIAGGAFLVMSFDHLRAVPKEVPAC